LTELTELSCEDAAADALWVTLDTAEPTDCAASAGPALPEADDDGDEDVVAALACWREKSTRRTRIPAASNPACIARRAMPRTVALATRCSQRRESLVSRYFFTVLARLHNIGPHLSGNLRGRISD
jgi:hypothetical protein